jgi:hypothetical protein
MKHLKEIGYGTLQALMQWPQGDQRAQFEIAGLRLKDGQKTTLSQLSPLHVIWFTLPNPCAWAIGSICPNKLL